LSKVSSHQDTLSKDTHFHYEVVKKEITQLLEQRLANTAKKYAYFESNLSSAVQWKPIVLVIGNYSAGKSTFINHLLGSPIQRTGQAPTDDSFSVIRYGSSQSSASHDGEVTEREGRVLLSDDALPFKRLKDQGERFLSHFRLKEVKSDILRHIDIIDTPGMLDSISENDRGYNYFEVIGELASVADLVLLLFDSHKAGTVRESYLSLRDVLPRYTGEDRIMFILNRVDECQSIDDLVRVYGALCWNLSQMTGRKDIPRIFLTYTTQGHADLSHIQDALLRAYLKEAAYQKEEIVAHILDVPRKRMDHLATYVETHSHRLRLLLKVLQAYRNRYRRLYVRVAMVLLAVVVLIGGISRFSSFSVIDALASLFSAPSLEDKLMLLVGGIGVGLVGYLAFHFWKVQYKKIFFMHISRYVSFSNQYEQDHWPTVSKWSRRLIYDKDYVIPSLTDLKRDHRNVFKMESEIARIRKIIGKIKVSSRASLKKKILANNSIDQPSQKAEQEPGKFHIPKREMDQASTLHQIINKQVNIMEEISSSAGDGASEEVVSHAKEHDQPDKEKTSQLKEETQPLKKVEG